MHHMAASGGVRKDAVSAGRSAILTECSRCRAVIFFKQINKVVDIVKTDKAADRLDIQVRGQQYFFAVSKRFSFR